jgi:TetR/AcrR family transcriptional regulator, regulator of cefoperazone and chloramphenicol sensitivity
MAGTSTVPVADTRERLLEAAGQVFSEAGFRAATVREIVTRAGGANIAAVNYHFRDKEGLYAAVLEHFSRAAVAKYPPGGGLPPGAPPEAQLHAFVRALLLRIFDKGQQSIHGKLMAWEMIEPTRALDRIVEQMIRPMYGRLCAIIKTLAGPRASLSSIERSAKSVVGQCLFYKHCAPVLERLEGRRAEAKDVDALAAHIVAFSLRGVRGIGTPRLAFAKAPASGRKGGGR